MQQGGPRPRIGSIVTCVPSSPVRAVHVHRLRCVQASPRAVHVHRPSSVHSVQSYSKHLLLMVRSLSVAMPTEEFSDVCIRNGPGPFQI